MLRFAVMYSRLVSGVTKGVWWQRAIVFLLLSSLAAISFIFVVIMKDSHQEVSRGFQTYATSLAASVSHDVDRNMELLDLSLQAIAEEWPNRDIQVLNPELRNSVLFGRSRSTQNDGSLFVLDQDGKVRAVSTDRIGLGVSFADRDYFRVHLMSSDIGLFVSKPFISRVNGKWYIALSRRIGPANQQLIGVAVAAIELEYFNSLYRKLDLGTKGAVTLFRTDSRIVTREPLIESDIRRSVGDSETFSVMRSSKMGTIEAPSPIDGKSRIISYHRVGTLPLIQDVEMSADEAYAQWWRRTAIIASLLALLCVGSIVLLIMLSIELRARVSAEAKLEKLVGTDPLTGIANRRRFDEVFEIEWRRTVRNGSHVALLMIDADSFKSYNDRYGHPAGDRLLISLALGIEGSIRRPGDLAARYGGEEFVVLLPDTDEGGALKVAENVRTAILALAEEHASSAAGVATVSIGVASLEPELRQPNSELVALADAALYRAKQTGRNCVRTSPRPVAATEETLRKAS